jgi:hypothetical protein
VPVSGVRRQRGSRERIAQKAAAKLAKHQELEGTLL